MVDEILKHDANRNVVDGAVTDDASQEVRNLRVDPTTGRLKVDTSISSGLPTDYAKDSSLTTLNAKDFATQTTLALIKAKTDNLDAALSTLKTVLDNIKAKTDNLTSDPATQTTLALIKAKTDNLDTALSTMKTVLDNIKTKTDNLTNNPSLETGGNLASILVELVLVLNKLSSVIITGTVIVSALPTGTNTIGKVKLTDGTNDVITETDDASIASGQKTLLVTSVSKIINGMAVSGTNVPIQ